jgi:hypothetical protein
MVREAANAQLIRFVLKVRELAFGHYVRHTRRTEICILLCDTGHVGTAEFDRGASPTNAGFDRVAWWDNLVGTAKRDRHAILALPAILPGDILVLHCSSRAAGVADFVCSFDRHAIPSKRWGDVVQRPFSLNTAERL